MSLFKTRDWWSTPVGEAEEFDHGCLCVANIDNEVNGYDKIILGSYHGILRIYNPQPQKTENGWSGYSAEDVILEQAFQQPILQVEAGRFSSGSDNLVLAILFPRRLGVYSISAVAGTVQHGSQYKCEVLYEHTLQRTAYKLCSGPFGGVKGKDFICLQSMDGTLSIFEQESFAFSRFLPGALLPGPIKYVPRLDSFVTVSSSWQVECYKYQVLAVASDSARKEESQNIRTGKRVTFDWCFNIGEQAQDIAVITFPQAPPSILILGERNIFCLTETGNLRYMKKLEYDPSCFLPYASLTEGTINYLVATHTKSLLIYQDVTIRWAAKTEYTPVQLQVANFRDLNGCIVTVSDAGHLSCVYLGTDPAIFVPPQVDSRELNYSKMDAEMSVLQQKIREKGGKSVITPNRNNEEDLQVNVHVGPNLDDISAATGMEIPGEASVPSITVRIQLKSRLLIENVKVDICAPWPLATNQNEFNVPSVEPKMPSELFVAVFQRGSSLVAHLFVQISVQYQNASGTRRISTVKAALPASLVMKAVPPVKTAVHKLTVDTNKPPVNLNDIFPELLGENAGGQGAALGFQMFGGPVVTVLASKTSQRYRLQCDRIEAMWIPLQELIKRLNKHFNRGKNGDFRASFDGSLPMQEYFELIDMHFECRLGVSSCAEMLNQRAAQFRVIQRRLLTRFKDKTPSPLQNLDTLLEGTFRQILALGEAVEESKMSQAVAANNLSSATYLLNLLIRLWLNLSNEEFAVLETTISPVVSDSAEQGWQEMTDAAVTHLLRTVLAKSAKDAAVNPSPLILPADTTKVKKHIALLCDRLGKGARLVEGMADMKERVIKMPGSKVIEEDRDGDGEIETNVVVPRYREKMHKKKKGGHTLNDLSSFGMPMSDQPSAV
ncbi:protein PTHB1-like isoform X2 [Pomacea canaliculata]|uniref:protein PTHB1-like isoform X2 n=1 Tax=Pomacea canaliculata TaxID=400727 RepID=UPI000D72D8F3|nr:protein PTHB1-like isoform X2 [Pomacea canaliculata]